MWSDCLWIQLACTCFYSASQACFEVTDWAFDELKIAWFKPRKCRTSSLSLHTDYCCCAGLIRHLANLFPDSNLRADLKVSRTCTDAFALRLALISPTSCLCNKQFSTIHNHTQPFTTSCQCACNHHPPALSSPWLLVCRPAMPLWRHAGASWPWLAPDSRRARTGDACCALQARL